MDDKFCKLPMSILQRDDLLPAAKLVWAALDGRIGTNGRAWPGIDCIRKDTGLSKNTVIRSIRQLTEKGLIFVEKTFGLANVYRLKNETSSESQPVLNCNPSQNETSPKMVPVPNCNPTSAKLGRVPVPNWDTNYTHRTIPKNYTKKKPEISIPEKLKSIQGFESAWGEWLNYWKERGKKLTSSTIKYQFKKLEKLPDPIGSIRQSIEGGWQGLFPLKGDSNHGTPDSEVNWSAEYHRIMGPSRNLSDEEFQRLSAEGN